MCVCVCVCVCSLIIKHAKHMHHTILSSVACLALPHSSTLSHKWTKYQISWKYVQWDLSCSKQTNRHRDTMKLTVAFRNFANVPKNCTDHQHSKLLACLLACLLYCHLKYRYLFFLYHWNFLFTQSCYSSIWSSWSTTNTHSMSFIHRPLLPWYWLTQIAKHQVPYDLENTAFGKFCRK